MNDSMVDMECDSLGNNFAYALVAGQNLTLSNGKIYSGNVAYGNQITEQNSNLTSTCAKFNTQSAYDFVSLKESIVRVSTKLMETPNNGQYSVSSGVLTLNAPSVADSNGLIVFTLAITDLISVQSIQVS